MLIGRAERCTVKLLGKTCCLVTGFTEWWLHGHRRDWRNYSTFKVRRGGSEEIPLVQGKEQWLRFAGAAMKRYPRSKVRETHVRW